jgi:hypothetical protein
VTVRRPSAVELTTTFSSQRNQPSDQHLPNTPNTAWTTKRKGAFVSIDKVNTF